MSRPKCGCRPHRHTEKCGELTNCITPLCGMYAGEIDSSKCKFHGVSDPPDKEANGNG